MQIQQQLAFNLFKGWFAMKILKDIAPHFSSTNRADMTNRSVRTVDLIPRQGSLNVNDMNLQTRAGALNFALSTLFGFGSQLKVQRQREQFSQFVQQELYSSAFGKGSREFGWTFTQCPARIDCNPECEPLMQS